MLLFITFVLTAFVLMIALVVYVDPFFHYHKPLKNFNYVVDNQLTQNPGMAEHLEYDSVILGSSMTVNFETDWFDGTENSEAQLQRGISEGSVQHYEADF